MSRLFRFELAFDGTPQGVGFLQGLANVGLWEVIEDGLYSLFETLPVCELGVDEPVSFWFTEYGLDRYDDSINRIADEIAENNWQLIGTSIDDDMKNAIYKDEFQVAFLRSDICERFILKYVDVKDIDEFRMSI